jgi:hypothetical protein
MKNDRRWLLDRRGLAADFCGKLLNLVEFGVWDNSR